LIGVGTISWCMGQVGAEHTARSISWNGIASYGAIAIGAPLGVVMVADYGLPAWASPCRCWLRWAWC
jgi:predicted MFS family arabinose efflux permease